MDHAISLSKVGIQNKKTMYTSRTVWLAVLPHLHWGNVNILLQIVRERILLHKENNLQNYQTRDFFRLCLIDNKGGWLRQGGQFYRSESQ